MEMIEGGQNQPNKRIKLVEIVEEEDGEDRVSALQDCLLLEILSRLPTTKEAIRTGTLSKRWKHLWTSVPTLIFKQNPSNELRSDFVWFVRKTLTQCRHSKLKKFEVYTNYDLRFEQQVDSCIRYAIKCNVEELNLTLLNTGFEADFPLRQFFFSTSCFTNLKLTGCIFRPRGEISWKNLRSLCIVNGKLDEDLMKNILAGSPVLETLELGDCYGYRRLHITSKSVKKLVFSGYMDPDKFCCDNIIEINAPNILSLTIQGELLLWKILLVNVASLVAANLDHTYMGPWGRSRKEEEKDMLKGFILSLRHVKDLKIGSSCSKVLSRLEAKGFSFPSNIKFPDITSDWSESESDTESENESESESESESGSGSGSESERESESESENESVSESESNSDSVESGD